MRGTYTTTYLDRVASTFTERRGLETLDIGAAYGSGQGNRRKSLGGAMLREIVVEEETLAILRQRFVCALMETS
jgi:hypothetical protein